MFCPGTSDRNRFIYRRPKTHKTAIVPFHVRDILQGTLCRLLKEAGIGKKELKDILKHQ
jgi:hypothetical protein